jgi:two-component system sensor histidine kinase LytS
LLAFILVNIRPFRRLLLDATPANLFKLALIFSAFAIISNLLGIEIDPDNHIMRETILWHVTPGYSVANVRILAVTVAWNRWRTWCWRTDGSGCRNSPE